MASIIGPYEQERDQGTSKSQVISRFKISKFEFLQALCFWGSSVDICLKEVVMHVRVFLMFGSHPH